MPDPGEKSALKGKKPEIKSPKTTDPAHLGSSNAFEETENPLSRDADDISDEKLDKLLEDE